MSPPSRTVSSSPARVRVPCLVSRPDSGRGLPRTRPRVQPRPGSDRGPTRRACSAARCPASSQAVPSGAPHQAKCLRRAGSPLATPRRPTASRAHRRPTSPRTACPGRRLPATRGGCLPATRLPRTASRGVPRPVVRLRRVWPAALSADRHPTQAEHRRAGSCRVTRRRPTASRVRRLPVRSRSPTASSVLPLREGRRKAPRPAHLAASCRATHRLPPAFRVLPPRVRGRTAPAAAPCPRTGT